MSGEPEVVELTVPDTVDVEPETDPDKLPVDPVIPLNNEPDDRPNGESKFVPDNKLPKILNLFTC